MYDIIIEHGLLWFNTFIKTATHRCILVFGVRLRPQFLFLLTRECFDLYAAEQSGGRCPRSIDFNVVSPTVPARWSPHWGDKSTMLEGTARPFFSRTLRREPKGREGLPVFPGDRLICSTADNSPADAFHITRGAKSAREHFVAAAWAAFLHIRRRHRVAGRFTFRDASKRKWEYKGQNLACEWKKTMKNEWI